MCRKCFYTKILPPHWVPFLIYLLSAVTGDHCNWIKLSWRIVFGTIKFIRPTSKTSYWIKQAKRQMAVSLVPIRLRNAEFRINFSSFYWLYSDHLRKLFWTSKYLKKFIPRLKNMLAYRHPPGLQETCGSKNFFNVHSWKKNFCHKYIINKD